MKKPLPYMTAAFLTVFLDLLSFGIIIPDLQTRAESLGLRGVAIGAVLSIYSVAQLLVAPYLGRLSDQMGRRKILLITAFLSIIAGGAYAFSTFLPVMILSRILLGSAAANLGVVYAYVSDVTEPQDRAKSMGMLGAAFGLGFLLGPPAGAL
ncbi:MAG: MFS transporter, partial [Armatimonadota bacterium]